MKKILFLLSFVLFAGHPYRIFSYDLNHASKLYGMLGTGTELFLGGIGSSYVAEFKSAEKLLQAATVDLQFMGILSPIAFEFNMGGTYGVGYVFDEGVRLIVDIIGLGLNVRSKGYTEIDSIVLYQPPPVSFMFNFPGFQVTFFDGLYAAWRNNFSIGSFMEFKTYFAIGFDFSKLYNPGFFTKKT